MEQNGRGTLVQGKYWNNVVDRNSWEWFHIFGKAISKQDTEAIEEKVPRNSQEPEVREQDRLDRVSVDPWKEKNVFRPGNHGDTAAFTVAAAAPWGWWDNWTTKHEWYV